jgi:hypothetical protein
MATLEIWFGAALLYGVFWWWYVGFRPRLTPQEVERYMAKLPAETADPERRERMRAFLAADDGREFFMVNLIRLHPGQVHPPGGGAPAPAARVLAGYTGPFLRALFRRAGHPALGGPAAAGYLEEWGVEKNPGWSFSGIIRYRSRRDLIELASAPEFAPIHVFKAAAMSNTLAFPIAPARLFFSPRVVVALAVALAASLLTHLVGS